jgi:hypothetical protein
MAYIGNTPADKFLTLAKQNFTTSATTSYTLDSSVSSTQDIALFINSVRQSPVDAYTVSGTALTLTSATAGTDEMYCVYLGKTVGTVVPASNTITNAMMTDDSVGVAELSATGTASSSTFLRGDNSWTAPGGVSLSGSTDNTITTVTGADALAGEANLTFDGTTLTVTGDATITNSGTGSTFIVNNTSGAMANGACGIKISITDTSDPDNWYALRIDDGSSHKFSVTGSGLTTIDTLTASSDVQTGSSKQLITSSDQRLKNDKGLLTDGITKIKQLKPRYYKWKEDVEKNGEDNASQQLGFFSQEINPIIPEAANKVALKDKDGNAILDKDGNQDYEWGLNTRAIVGVLVKSVQELSEEIETLKTKVTALENK